MKPLGREAGAAVVAVFGALVVRLVAEGAHRRFVRPGMGPFLLVAGAIAIALAAATLTGRRDHDDHDHDHHDDHGHDHAHAPGRLDVGWLLLAPVLVVLLIAPPALGSFSLSRSSASVAVERGGASFPALDPAAGPHRMAVLEYTSRAIDADGRSLTGVAVALTGFVGGSGDAGFLVARYSIACCAADAAPAIVDVVDWDGPVPARDTWVTVTGRFTPGGDPIPRLVADGVTPVPTPDEPYE